MAAGEGQRESDRSLMDKASSDAVEAVVRALSVAKERLGPFIKDKTLEANAASVSAPRPNVAPAYEAMFSNALSIKEAATQIKDLIQAAEL